MRKTRNIFLLLVSSLFVLTITPAIAMKTATVQATTSVAEIVMNEKASVRKKTDKSGIRFTAYVGNSYFDQDGTLQDNTVAGVIITKGAVEAGTLTHTSGEVNGAYANKVLDIPATVWDKKNDTATGKAFNAVVYNIPQTLYGDDLTARGYVGVYNTTTEKYDYVYSDNACVRNVAQVASIALAEGEEDTYGTLVKYVDGVNGDVSVDGKTDETVEVTLGIGQSVDVVATPAYLTPVFGNINNSCVKVEAGKITATKYNAENATATVSVKLGSLEKTVNITIKNEFVDSNIADNVLADMNETNYAYGVYSANPTFYGTINVLDAETAKTETGANSGVVKVTTRYNWEEVVFKFAKKVDVTKVAGIYITMKYDAQFEGKMWLRLPKSDGTFVEKAINATNIRTYTSANGGWNKITIPYAEIVRSFAGITEISELRVMPVPTGTAGDECPTLFYVDEIGVVTATGNELLNFDDATDVNMVWGRFVTVSHLDPNATGYPANVGATTGVVEYPTVDDGCPSQFYFKQFVNTANVSQIVLRMYVPNGFGDHRIRVYVNANDGTRTEITSGGAPLKVSGVCNGQFADIVVNLSSLASGTILNSLEIMRHWKVNTTGTTSYWIDSITYVAK